MSPESLEFLGNFLIQAAKWQKQFEQASTVLKPSHQAAEELAGLYQKIFGQTDPEKSSSAEYDRLWKQAIESFWSVSDLYARMWGWIPLADYLTLQKKCDALEIKIQDQDRVISQLRSLLDEKGLGHMDLIQQYQSLIQNQSDEFQTFMQTLGEALTKDFKLSSDCNTSVKRS